MNKKSKKQPYRNALLRLRKKHVLLDSLYKENQCLNADALYKREEAQTLLKSAVHDKEQTEVLHKEALKELKQYNPYHPALCSITEIQGVSTEDHVLRYRISAPRIGWNDEKKSGMVRMVCYEQSSNNYKTVAYGFSAKLINDCKEIINEDYIDMISNDIARELISLATTEMKEW